MGKLGIGQLVAGFLAWAFIPNFSCTDPSVDPSAPPCTKANNKGWRYVWYAAGSLVFVMSILRITVIRLQETPKFLVGEGRDAECVEILQFIAKKYNRTCSLNVLCAASQSPSSLLAIQARATKFGLLCHHCICSGAREIAAGQGTRRKWPHT